MFVFLVTNCILVISKHQRKPEEQFRYTIIIGY